MLGPAVTEDAQAGSVAGNGTEIELMNQHRLAYLIGFGDLGLQFVSSAMKDEP